MYDPVQVLKTERFSFVGRKQKIQSLFVPTSPHINIYIYNVIAVLYVSFAINTIPNCVHLAHCEDITLMYYFSSEGPRFSHRENVARPVLNIDERSVFNESLSSSRCNTYIYIYLLCIYHHRTLTSF